MLLYIFINIFSIFMDIFNIYIYNNRHIVVRSLYYLKRLHEYSTKLL